jgi:nucleotide-binding universal stress UspA family protein
MIKKLICPTDFSKAATNATEYAAKLAQVFGATLLFVNVQRITPVAATVSMGDGIGANVRENSRLIVHRLKELSAEVNKMYKISTDYEVDITTKSLAKILASMESENAMIVMGTNGADDTYQFFFGTNTYQVIKNAKCAVLMVPENVAYESIEKIVFAWDYDSKSKFSFSLPAELMKPFDPELIFLHIDKQNTDINLNLFSAFQIQVKAVLGEKYDINFKQIISDDVPDAINKYMIKSKADLLAITYYYRGTIRDLFHGTVAKALTQTADYPIFILHA